MLTAVAGCASGHADGPAVVTTQRPWTDAGLNGVELRSPHYRVLTTVRDRASTDRLMRVLEAAHAEYAALLPPRDAADRPLIVYLFARPDEWEAFTRRLTGPAAGVYLSVGPGGYAYGDVVVCWLFTEADLWPTVAHEGLHQYFARHLTQRLPASLEEGLACTFESVAVGETSVRFDRRRNARRTEGLVAGERAGALMPIDALVAGHAGEVAAKEWVVREAFYGQCWAMARVVLESPARAIGLRRMLADLRDGRADRPIGTPVDRSAYRPAAVRPLVQRYVAGDWAAFDQALMAFVRSLTVTGRDD